MRSSFPALEGAPDTVLSNYLYNGVAVALTTTAAILASVVLARAFGPEQWGVYSQVAWLLAIAVTVFGGGLTYTAMRYLGAYSMSDDSAQKARVAVWLVKAQLLLVVPGCLLFLLFAPQINSLMSWHLDLRLIRLSALGILALSLFQLGMAMLRGLQEYRFLAALSMLSSTMTLGTIVIVLRYPRVDVLITVTALGQLLLLIPLAIRLLKGCSDSASHLASAHAPTVWRPILRYSLLVFVTTLADQVVWQRSEVFFLGQLGDPAQSGYYSLAYTIAGIAIGTVTMAITGTLTPQFSYSAGTSGQRRIELPDLYRQSFSLLNWIVVPCSIGLAIVGPRLISAVYGQAYAPVAPVLYLVIVSTVVGVYARPSASIIHAINKPLVLLISSLAVLPLDVAMAWYLVPRQGAIGAAVANLAAQWLGAAILVVYASKTAALHYDWCSMGKSLVGAVACGIAASLMLSCVKSPLLSVLFAITAGGIAYYACGIVLRDDTTYSITSAVKSKVTALSSSLG